MSLTVHLHDHAGKLIGRHAIRDGRAFPDVVYTYPVDCVIRFYRRSSEQGVGRDSDQYHEFTPAKATLIPESDDAR